MLIPSCRWGILMAAFLLGAFFKMGAADLPPPGNDGPSQRAYQVAVLNKIVGPVLQAGAEGKLREKIPPIGTDRDQWAPLEALGRTLSGIAPWLELGPGEDAEGKLRKRMIDQAVQSIRLAVDPQSPAFMNFTTGGQPLVDTAYLAQALLRAPKQLWGNLNEKDRANVIAALKSSRVIKPSANNWELFSAMVEVALLEFTGECEMGRIEKAVADHMLWYKGDGAYGDGPSFHWDYYNSYVIHPMLWQVLEVCEKNKRETGGNLALVKTRARRYAAVLEMMISPEGSYPIIGRSAPYRFGAFQMLAMTGLRHQLPGNLTPGGVRSALNAVIQRVIEAPGNFDENGWLRLGVVGYQPRMANNYTNNGSLYICTEGLLQLGLPPDDPFWTEPGQSWTQKKLWSGENLPGDHAIGE